MKIILKIIIQVAVQIMKIILILILNKIQMIKIKKKTISNKNLITVNPKQIFIQKYLFD